MFSAAPHSRDQGSNESGNSDVSIYSSDSGAIQGLRWLDREGDRFNTPAAKQRLVPLAFPTLRDLLAMSSSSSSSGRSDMTQDSDGFWMNREARPSGFLLSKIPLERQTEMENYMVERGDFEGISRLEAARRDGSIKNMDRLDDYLLRHYKDDPIRQEPRTGGMPYQPTSPSRHDYEELVRRQMAQAQAQAQAERERQRSARPMDLLKSLFKRDRYR
jgi:hypothetical protein